MKKFLSMVLALAMAMSLVTFAAPAAGAKDFTDNSSIQYKEAVDVISAIQIMDGYADASFNPSGTLTRGAAAKIICNMILGPTTASALPTNVAPFPDVAAGSTFAGYIAYCSEHAIISGYADGNFRPADSLSGYAFLKMLLCALGYDQKIEGYQGANWRVNVAKQALGIGLDNGLTTELDGSRIVTREEAALYAFNTLQSDLVEYENKTTVSVSGATVTVGGNNFHSKTSLSQNTSFNNIDNGAMAGGAAGAAQIIQFAEEYFNRLERTPKKNFDFRGEGDLFGRPSTKWTWKGVEIDTYKVAPAKTYDGGVKVSDIYNDLALGGTAENAYVFVNGVEAFRIDVERSNGEKVFHKDDQKDAYHWVGGVKTSYTAADADFAAFCDKVGDGTIVEVFRNDADNRIVISAQSVYPGKIDSIHSKSSTKDAYVVIEDLNVNGATEDVLNFSKSGRDEFEVDGGFQEDDVVWFTYSASKHEIGEVHKMQSVEGSLNRRVDNKSVTLSNVVYKFGEEVAFDMTSKGQSQEDGDNSMSNGSSYIVYTDSNGWVLWVEEADFSVDQYAVIERISVDGNSSNVMSRYLAGNTSMWDESGTSWDGNRVRLLLPNGTERNYDLDESKRYRDDGTTTGIGAEAISDNNGLTTAFTWNERIKEAYDAGQVVRYVVNNDGTVRLSTIGSVPGSTQVGETTNVRTANTEDNATLGPAGLPDFYIDGHKMYHLYRYDGPTGNDYVKVEADSDTIFVVKNPDSTKTYTGLRNVPDVKPQTGVATTISAYAYLDSSKTKPMAKLVYVIVDKAGAVVSSSKDITFLTDPSDPYTSDTGDPYVEYNAVIKGVIQTEPVYVYTNKTLVGAKDQADYPIVAGGRDDGNAPSVRVGDDFKTGSIILNVTEYDNDDFLWKGEFSHATMQSVVAQGIKKTSRDDEIKVDEHDNGRTETLASGVNIFYYYDGAFAKITVSEIRNDTDDMVYYTLDESGEITNLFIVDYEDDDYYIADVTVTAGKGGNPDKISFTFNANELDYDANKDGNVDALDTYYQVWAYESHTGAGGHTLKRVSSLCGDLVKAMNMDSRYRNVRFNATNNSIDGTFNGGSLDGIVFSVNADFDEPNNNYTGDINYYIP